MSAMTEEHAIFENDEWLVSELGLEHKRTGYFIERAGIANRREDGLWTWPMHMSEKSWCRMPLFTEAFLQAASAYRIETEGLTRTFQIARCEVVEPIRRSTFDAPLLILRKDDGTTISGEPIFLKNSMPDKGFLGSLDAGPARFRAKRYPTSTTVRQRGPALGWVRSGWVRSALSRHASHRIRRTGSTLVRLIQVAWNIR